MGLLLLALGFIFLVYDGIRSISDGGILLTKNLDSVVRLIERLTGIEVMPADVYYISGVPTAIEPSDIALVAVVALIMCLVATIYPAHRASRTDPASALRYE